MTTIPNCLCLVFTLFSGFLEIFPFKIFNSFAVLLKICDVSTSLELFLTSCVTLKSQLHLSSFHIPPTRITCWCLFLTSHCLQIKKFFKLHKENKKCAGWVSFFLHQNRESLLGQALKVSIVIILKHLIVRRNMTQLCGIRFWHLHCCVYSV